MLKQLHPPAPRSWQNISLLPIFPEREADFSRFFTHTVIPFLKMVDNTGYIHSIFCRVQIPAHPGSNILPARE